MKVYFGGPFYFDGIDSATHEWPLSLEFTTFNEASNDLGSWSLSDPIHYSVGLKI